MDYVTRQFINLAKKLRDEVREARETLHADLSSLANRLANLKDAISEHWQTEKHRDHINSSVTIADLQTQVPIRVQTEAKRSKIETCWRYLKGAFEIAGIVAVILYTNFAYQQWQVMMSANDVSMSSFRRARIDANGQLKETRNQTATAIAVEQLDQRAWIGLNDIKMKVFKEGTYPEIFFTFINSGKTPAREVKTQVYWKASGTNGPFCEGKDRRPFPAPSIPPQGKYTLRNPRDNPWYIEDALHNQYWTQFEGASLVCVFGEISYADIFSETRHTTHFCVYAYPESPEKFGYCPQFNTNNMD